MEHYTQARIGGNHPPETTGKFIAAKFEHDTARPVDGYVAPQLHTHAVVFNVTERDNGQPRAIQPQSLFASQQFATAIYQSELTYRLRQLGYEITTGRSGAPEIKGYTQEYLDASSPRSQQIREYLERTGRSGKEAAQGVQQLKTDLAGGETDTVEFKPFMEPKNKKESEFIKTIVAFANTYGGRLYVGADDDGSLQGEAEVRKVFRGSIDEALAAQMSRLKELIRENVKPVPLVDVRQIALGADRIVVAEVQRGNNPPYATHQNQIYVRKGATSRTADPSELRALISAICLQF